MRSPLLALAACFASGIVVAGPDPLPSRPLVGALVHAIPLLLGCAAACLLAGLVALRVRWHPVARMLALTGFVLAGAATERLFEFRFPPRHVSHLESRGVSLSRPVRLEGRLLRDPLRTPYGSQFDVEAMRLEVGDQVLAVSGKVRLRLETAEDSGDQPAADAPRLRSGDFIGAEVRLQRPQAYRNPGSFDFRRWMESVEDIYWLGTIRGPLLAARLGPRLPSGTSPDRIRRALAALQSKATGLTEGVRQRLLQGIDRLYPPWLPEGRDGAVLKAVLLGDRSSLDSDTIEDFRKVGLYHLLVIAGLHVGLLAMLAEFLLRLLRLGETARSGLVLLFLLGFAALVEQRAPTLRATLMICAYLFARLLYRRQPALNGIGLAALLLLLARPAWLFESGFDLSFSAALLIAGLAVPILDRTTEPYRRALHQLEAVDLDPSLEPRLAQFRLDLRALVEGAKARFAFLSRHPAAAEAVVTAPARVAVWTANTLLFSSVLQFGLLLPMAVTFHRVTYAGIGLNALAIPVMTLVLALALPTTALGALLPTLAAWPAKALAVVMQGLFALTDFPNLPHWLSYRVPSPPAWVAYGFVVSLVAAACAVGRHRRTFGSALGASGVFAALISLHPFSPRLPAGKFEVTALDCGGGDAVFVVLPDLQTMLVGACGSRSRSMREGQRRRWDPGEEIVSPYLWQRGIKRIDVLVLADTRGNQPGGFAALLQNFEVGELWQAGAGTRGWGLNSTAAPAPALEALRDEARERGVPVRELVAGQVVALGQASVRILWPAASAPAARDAEGPGRRSVPRLPRTDDSLVMRISSGDSSVLLPGDIDEKVERELVDSPLPLSSELLQVARHGARTSSGPEFLARVSPRIAIVAAESASPRYSPSQETLDRLRASGARLFRTDRDGAVTVDMDVDSEKNGTPVTVHTFVPTQPGDP
jgi:competence protein ComEC